MSNPPISEALSDYAAARAAQQEADEERAVEALAAAKTTPEPPEPENADEAPEGDNETGAGVDEGKRKLRNRAQAAEAERDRLAEQLDQARRSIVENATKMRKPELLWRLGHNPADFFTPEGTLDRTLVDAAVTELGLPTRPYVDTRAGCGGPTGPSFTDAFRRPMK